MKSIHFVCLYLSACISIILIQGDKLELKTPNNSKYLISGINSSIFRFWHGHTGRVEKVRVILLLFLYFRCILSVFIYFC